MRYDEALRLLESAESGALEGLARVAQPRLLSNIYLQRAVALLPTDRGAARRYLVQTYVHWPGRSLDGEAYAPKMLEELRRATPLDLRREEASDLPDHAVPDLRPPDGWKPDGPKPDGPPLPTCPGPIVLDSTTPGMPVNIGHNCGSGKLLDKKITFALPPWPTLDKIASVAVSMEVGSAGMNEAKLWINGNGPLDVPLPAKGTCNTANKTCSNNCDTYSGTPCSADKDCVCEGCTTYGPADYAAAYWDASPTTLEFKYWPASQYCIMFNKITITLTYKPGVCTP